MGTAWKCDLNRDPIFPLTTGFTNRLHYIVLGRYFHKQMLQWRWGLPKQTVFWFHFFCLSQFICHWQVLENGYVSFACFLTSRWCLRFVWGSQYSDPKCGSKCRTAAGWRVMICTWSPFSKAQCSDVFGLAVYVHYARVPNSRPCTYGCGDTEISLTTFVFILLSLSAKTHKCSLQPQ